jgi:SPP1 gp7 family putative phage head morphogenesis protein
VGDSYTGTIDVENLEFFQNLLPTLKQVFKQIYREKKAQAIHPELFEKTKNKFWAGLTKGFRPGADVAGADTLARSLQTNLVTFSLFKNHQNMKAVAGLLVDNTTGKPRTYEAFEREALKVSVDYNRNWLQAEFDTAVKSSESATQWLQIQKTKKDFPLLQYVTQHDENVRHEHATFDGTTLPVEHPWWRTHFPPNGFRCRCYVKQLRKGEADVTANPDKETYGTQFNFNSGITGEIFAQGHTYFKDVPEETVKLLTDYSASVTLKSKWW